MNSESKAAANGVWLLIIDNKIIQFSHIFKYVTYKQRVGGSNPSTPTNRPR